MSTARSPTLKRILREAAELSTAPSPDYHASPLESDLFEWHFTIRGPPSPSPFAGGLYHGRIILPPAYPLKPPSFRFLTPSGRFEVNREICLSISGHHEETWQPAWGIRTALVAIRSFMDTEARGQLGGMESGRAARERWARESVGWRCAGCGGRSNGEVMGEVEERCRREGVEGKEVVEVVPEELRLGYREDLQAGEEEEGPREGDAVAGAAVGAIPASTPSANMPASTPIQPTRPPPPEQSPMPGPPLPQVLQPAQPPPAQPQQPQQRPAQIQPEGIPPWIDKAILGVIIALLYLLWERFG